MQLIREADWQTLYVNDQLHAQQVRASVSVSRWWCSVCLQVSGAAFSMLREQTPPPFRPTAPLTRGMTGEYQPGVRPSVPVASVSFA
jgi:hypothetical protein